jgi:CDGSH-type Zn-finger protein
MVQTWGPPLPQERSRPWQLVNWQVPAVVTTVWDGVEDTVGTGVLLTGDAEVQPAARAATSRTVQRQSIRTRGRTDVMIPDLPLPDYLWVIRVQDFWQVPGIPEKDPGLDPNRLIHAFTINLYTIVKTMTENRPSQTPPAHDGMKIIVSRNGPYLVSGGVPLIIAEICNDDEGNCRTWKQVKRFPALESYALCRCGRSKNKPFCDGSHATSPFNGTERAGDEPYLLHPKKIHGPTLDLEDVEDLCVHARFCMRAGGIWNLTKQSDIPEARETAIEEASNCPSGRLVVRDRATGKAIEPPLEKSIVVIEYPPRGEHGPLWVRGGIPVESCDGKQYTTRNRLTLCRCGKSRNKPFCDGSHVER